MTSTSITETIQGIAIGIPLGLGASALAYLTVPAYHDMCVASWALVGIDLVSIFG